MTGTAASELGWNWRRWLFLLGCGVGIHAGLVFWLGERADRSPRKPGPTVSLKWALDPGFDAKLAEAAVLSDPSMFALPSPHGFSGLAWLHPQPTVLPSNHWTAPDGRLELDTHELGAVFSQVMATNPPTFAFGEEALAPQPLDSALFRAETTQTQTVVRVEGPLAERAILRSVDPPEPVYPDVLQPTTVQVSVNADGLTETAIVTGRCRLKGLDEQAAELARRFVFEPVPHPGNPAPPNMWGWLIFRWHTLPPPPLTNTPPTSLP